MLTIDSLRRLNHTEAYQLCRRLQIPCLPSDARDVLLQYLLGEVESPPVSEALHPFDSWRHGLGGFVKDFWLQIQTQLTCPIRSGDFRSCFGCLDTQVTECLVRNHQNAHLITLHRKTE